MQRFSDNLPRIAHSAARTGARHHHASAHTLDQAWPGAVAELQPTNIMRHIEVGPAFSIHPGPLAGVPCRCRWRIWLPSGAAIAGLDLTPPRDALYPSPHHAAMAKLQPAARRRPGHLAERCSRNHRQSRRGAWAGAGACSGAGRLPQSRKEARRGYRSALRRRAIDPAPVSQGNGEDPDQALYIPDLCRAIRVSGEDVALVLPGAAWDPKRYLQLRRMHLARRALREGVSTKTTVTEIATQYGFWQFGRFAGEYRSLFGELPSATLSHSRE